MKIKLITIFLVSVALASCTQSNEQKAQTLTKKYLDSTLNDAKSYEAVKFSKLDTLTESIDENSQYRNYEQVKDSLKTIADSLHNAILGAIVSSPSDTANLKHKADSIYSKQEKNLEDEKAFIEKFKGKPIGWVISHTYRAKNAMGAVVLSTNLFRFDQNLTKVTDVK
ncbi:hypothetical protein [Mucilaginibacter ginsenosidivorax]|uniref:Uncharacterized protein n=1 Tax=Mucilaginibacter ginsenosidivorax TaxID=862126 RepID=A0A5B8W8R5_9SPHI|nr:hypothetical protein [Mucilaginibacter ginsenosidivorax]QEC80294.1 hypothetical protein FSB76_31665 [Mucilaginibacter ginsenosidivorax]